MRLTPLLLMAACSGASAPAPPPAPAPDAPLTPAHLPLDAPGGLREAVGRPVGIEGRDLVLRAQGGEVHVAYLSGQLTPAAGGDLVDLEDPRSFEVTVDALEIVIPEQTLERAMGGGEKPPFRDLKVRTEGDAVLLDGHAGGLGLPFSFRADPGVTPRGALGLHLEKARVLGIGVKGFLEAFQRPVEKKANAHGHLLDIEDDWLVVDPFPFAGPPEVHARFTSVEVREHGIVARLGELSGREEAREAGGLTLTGGAFRTGKTILLDATMRLVARDGGALVIDPATMQDQIAGGVVKNTKEGDVTVYVLAPGDSPVDPTTPRSGGPEEKRTPPGADPTAPAAPKPEQETR